MLNKLDENDIAPVIVVDDGSGEEYGEIFEQVKEIVNTKGGTVLTHNINMGKGKALKTAFSYVLENYDTCIGVVTADSFFLTLF